MARFNTLDDWLHWQESHHPKRINLGLERVEKIFKVLNPKKIQPLTIIVAGTNGKGSCIAFLESIYRAQGYNVGCYTSPHLLSYNERIKINRKPIADTQICQAFERIDAIRHDISLSYFEFGTLAALDIFWRSDLDIQLLEIGLGGRLDAVNIIDADVSIVTNISIDHIDWLGETREAIAYEKAGVFRQNIPAIIGDLDPPDALLSSALEKKAFPYCINKAYSFQKTEADWEWSCQTSQSCRYLSLPKPSLKGDHQYINASVALMAITALQDSLPITEKAIHQGLENTQIKGRFQLVTNHETHVLLDVAHNAHSVQVLFNHLQKTYPNKKIHAVFSMMKDKDIQSVIDIIKPTIKQWYISPLNSPRGASLTSIQNCLKKEDLKSVHTSFSKAFQSAKNNTNSNDLILVFGSFLIVSEYFLQSHNN